MIIENRIEEFNYASLLIADMHREYPLQGVARIIFDPFEISTVMAALNVTDIDLDMTQSMLFRDLPRRYNGDYDEGMALWIVRGHSIAITNVFDDLAQQLMGGPRGADDDTFDYWPNAFGMLCVMADDLCAIDDARSDYVLRTVVRVIDSAIALQGPPSEWEAEFLDDKLNHLKQILDERKEA